MFEVFYSVPSYVFFPEICFKPKLLNYIYITKVIIHGFTPH